MNLHNLDTLSIVSTRLVNAGLKAGADRLVTRFDYREGKVHVAGRFGAWRVLAGGSARLLHVEIPIAEGRLAGLGGGEEADLADVALRLEIALKLVPAPDGSGAAELRFDLERNPMLLGAGPVSPTQIVDPGNRLSRFARAVLAETAAGCLAAHVKDISYVFATVGSGATGGLQMPYSGWQYLETGDGRGFLAVTGSLNPIGDEGIDPQMLKGGAEAVFAISKRAFMTRLLLPYLQRNFRPSAPFAYDAKGQSVRAARAIRLPDLKSGIWWVSPTITSLVFTLGKNMMTCTAVTTSAMPLGTTFHCTVTPKMAFVLSGHAVAFRPDPHPHETHSVGLPGTLDWLIGWFVNWLVGFFVAPINQLVTSIARSMQTMNTPAQRPVTWSGIRAFETGAAELGDCFWLADARVPSSTEDGIPEQSRSTRALDCP